MNIISNRPSDVAPGFYGLISGGFGNQGYGTGTLDMSARFGSSEAFLNVNNQTTSRGLDAPTFVPQNDASSSSDQFLRFITELNPRATMAFDYSNQFSQFQIPINTDPNNPHDPIYSVPGTLDTQLEYDRFSNLNFTFTSKDGNGIVQFVPWWRSTRIDYQGDLAADVLGTQPNFGCPTFPMCQKPYPETLNSVGLQQNTYANYLGFNLSDFRATANHAWKVGLQVDRENATSDQTFACYYEYCNVPGPQGNPKLPLMHIAPYYASVTPSQAQPGTNFSLYGEDKWQVSQNVVFNYGLRYDHSTGYVGGWQISPRVGVNVSDGGKNVVHAYYGKFYAAPLLEDVRAACVVFAAQNACPTTAPVYDLKPESDSYYEIGVAHQFNPLMTGYVNFFQKSVVNILDTTQFLNTPLFAVYNNAIGINHGLELRLQDRPLNGDQWFLSATVSGSYAGGISGSTFLFPPNPPGISITSPAGLAVEDHDETVTSTAGYTHRFGNYKMWFATLQANYGSGFPVQFQDANINLSGRLPAHTTFDVALGRNLTPGKGPQDQGLGLQLLVNNLLNHQYVIKVANGFNTTQIANGRTIQFKVTAPF
ncbi:MAG: TonB-dependent receptor [Candidatus Eremiobacteraeota bacterium]|nr:TonB-dependent receptor [Candidatus Eremiobacteraeota bacterium]